MTDNPTSQANSSENHSANITHETHKVSFEQAYYALKDKIEHNTHLSKEQLQEQLSVLHDLSQFALGRFLIINRGLNGYWTDYVLKHPNNGRLTGINQEGAPLTWLESFLLDKAPVVLATQQRFIIFKQELQKLLKNGVRILSCPCGLMSDLLDLNFTAYQDFTLIGSDIDPDALLQAQRAAQKRGLADHCQFIEADAWKLSLQEPVDIVTSNGLNIYESDDQRVTSLYHRFYQLLKSEGVFISSFLTVPAGLPHSEWDTSQVNLEHAQKQKLIFSDILNIHWQTFRSYETTSNQLKEAGFKEVCFIDGYAGVFPTFIAKKST